MPDIHKIMNEVVNGKEEKTPSLTSFSGEPQTPNLQEDFFADLFSPRRTSDIYLTESDKTKLDKQNRSILDPNTFRNPDEQNKLAAKEQSWLNQLWHSLLQIGVSEAVLGSAKGLADLPQVVSALGAEGLNKLNENWGRAWEENDFHNEVSDKIQSLIDSFNENVAPIYRENPNRAFDIGDFGWWAENFTTVGSTLSLLIPAKAASSVVGGISKLAKLDRVIPGTFKAVNKLSKTPNAARALKKGLQANEAVNIGSEALFSRLAENYQEARDAYDQGKETALKYLNEFTEEEKNKFIQSHPELANKSNDEIASFIANQGATQAFKNDMWLMLFDFLQYKSINDAFKSVSSSKVAGVSQRVAQEKALNELAGIETAAEKGVGKYLRATKDYVKDAAKYAWKHPMESIEGIEFTEAIEEGWQGIQGKEANELVNTYFDPYTTDKAFYEYLTDPEILEQALWGMLGGIAFQAAGKGFNKLSGAAEGTYKLYKDRNKAEDDKTKFTQKDFESLVFAESERRNREIQNRKNLVDNFKRNIEQIKNNTNPFKEGNAKIETEAEKEYLFQQTINDFTTEITLNAVDAGNISLLKDMLKDERFTNYYREQGLENVANIESVVNQRMEQVEDLYTQAKEDVINNINVDNFDVANAIARQITRQKLSIEELDDKIADERDTLSRSSGYEYWSPLLDNYFYQNFVSKEIKENLAAYKAINEQLAKGKVSKAAARAEQQRIQSYINDLVNFGKNYNLDYQLDELSDLSKADDAKIIKAINNTMASTEQALKDQGYEDLSSVPKSIVEQNQQIIIDSINRFRAEAFLPKTQNDFEELYNNTQILVGRQLSKRTGNAISKVRRYLMQNADNIDDAVKNLFNEENISNKLKDAMDILRIGSSNSQLLTEMFKQEVNKIKNDQQKNVESESTGTVNGEPTTTAQAKKANDEINANDSSMGVSQQQTVAEPTTTTEIKQPVTEEEVNRPGGYTEEQELTPPPGIELGDIEPEDESIPKEVNEVLEASLPDAEQTTYIENSRRTWVAITKWFEEHKGEGRRFLQGETEATKLYNEIFDDVKKQLIDSGELRPDEADTFVSQELKNFIALINSRQQNNTDIKQSLRKVIDSISKVGGRLNISEDASSISPITNEELEQSVEELIENYFNAGNRIAVKIDGKTPVSVYGVIKYIKDLIEEQNLPYNILVNFVNNFYSVVNNYNGNKYIFVDKFIDGKELNLSTIKDLLNEIYIKSSIESYEDNNVHIALSNNLRRSGNLKQVLENLKGKKLVTKLYEGNSVGIGYYTDEGKFIEVGYISKVYRTDKNGSIKYSLINTQDTINSSVYKDDTGYHIDNYYDFVFRAVIESLRKDSSDKDINDLRDFLISKLIADNSELDLADGIIFKQPSVKEFVAIANNPYFKRFIDTNTLNQFAIIENGKVVAYRSEGIKLINDAVNQINQIIFYPYFNIAATKFNVPLFSASSYAIISESYNNYAKKMFENYELTDALQNGAKPNIEFVATNLQTLNYVKGSTKSIADIGIETTTNVHPLIMVSPTDPTLMIDENGKIYPNAAGFTPSTMGILMDVRAGNPMIALLKESNPVKSDSAIGKAIVEHIQNALNNYYNAAASEATNAYEKLYDTFSELFTDKNRLFTGINIFKGTNGFQIYKVDKDGNKQTLATFYKYDATYKKGIFYDKEGNPIPTEQLNNYKGRTGRIVLKNKEYYIKNTNSKGSQNVINQFINNLVNNIVYNESGVAIRKESNNIISYTNNGIEIKLGNKTFKYINFTDFLVKNGAFNTTHSGVGRNGIYSSEGNGIPNSLFMKIDYQQQVVTEEEFGAVAGIIGALSNGTIRKAPVSFDQVMSIIGFDEATRQIYQKLDEQLGKDSIIPKEIYFDTNSNKDIFAGFDKQTGRINIYAKGIGNIQMDRNEFVRLSIHERFHQLVEQKKFFKDKKYGKARIDALIDTYNQFIKSLETIDKNHPIHTFAKQFNDYYGKFNISENYDERETLANEWAAEVISNKYLMDYLNKIDYIRPDNVITTKRKSLFQRIIDLLSELFGLQNIKKNTILDGFYNALGYPTEVNTFDEANSKTKQEKTEDTTPTTIEIIDNKQTPVEELMPEDDTEVSDRKPLFDDDGNFIEGDEEIADLDSANIEDFNSIDEDFNFSAINPLKESVKLTPEEVQLNAYDKDRGFNPNEISMVNDMNEFLNKYPADKRPTIAIEVANGRLKHLCR